MDKSDLENSRWTAVHGMLSKIQAAILTAGGAVDQDRLLDMPVRELLTMFACNRVYIKAVYVPPREEMEELGVNTTKLGTPPSQPVAFPEDALSGDAYSTDRKRNVDLILKVLRDQLLGARQTHVAVRNAFKREAFQNEVHKTPLDGRTFVFEINGGGGDQTASIGM